MNKQKVLIADDSEINRALLIEILENQYDIVEAENGVEAITLLSRYGTEFSLLLLDIMMPEMDGFEVLAYIKDVYKRQAIQHALDENGFQDQYVLQSFGTSELGGKIMAEGKNLEADIITMSSYYIDSAQQKNDMFDKLTFPTPTLKTYSDYDTPLTALEGAMIEMCIRDRKKVV